METPKQPETSREPSNIGSLFQTAQPTTEEQPVNVAASIENEPIEPKKKKYYSPSEVMKKKGCIGCGGMTFAMIGLATLIAAALAFI